MMTDFLDWCIERREAELLPERKAKWETEEKPKWEAEEKPKWEAEEFSQLVKILLGDKNYSALERASEDQEHRMELYDKYAIGK